MVIAPAAPIVVAAVAATTAGIVDTVFATGLSIPLLGTMLLLGAAALAIFGGYGWLDRINRLLLAFLILSTLATILMVLPRVDWNSITDIGWAVDPAALLFVVALAGFMPNPVDISVSQSMWTIEAEQQRGTQSGDQQGSTLSEAPTAFLSAPIIAALNHLVLTRCTVPDHARPSRGIRTLSLVAIVLMATLAALYLVLTFGR